MVKNAIFSANCTALIQEGTISGYDIETSALIATRLADRERPWQTLVPAREERRHHRDGTAFIFVGDRNLNAISAEPWRARRLERRAAAKALGGPLTTPRR